MAEEGWYRDPYGLHTDRWISTGRPTSLVRDDGVESRDEPPTDVVPGHLVEIPEAASQDGANDLKRADAATSRDQSFSAGEAMRAVLDGSGEMGIGFR